MVKRFPITHVCTFALSVCAFINRNSVFADWTMWKGTHASESMILKMSYLYGFIRWTKCIWWAIKNNYLLVSEWIPAIRNKAETSQVIK